MWDLGALRDRGDFARRLAVTAAALIVYRLGAHIPLPGLDPHALSCSTGPTARPSSASRSWRSASTRLSAFSSWPSWRSSLFRRCGAGNTRMRAIATRLNRWLVLLAIGAAVVQAHGYARALEGVTQLVTEPGVAFRIACVATLVAGTAFVIWLADLITRHGLGSGVWLLFVVPALADLPDRVGALAGLLAEGSISPPAVLAWAAPVVLAIAAHRAPSAGGRRTAESCRGQLPVADAAQLCGCRGCLSSLSLAVDRRHMPTSPPPGSSPAAARDRRARRLARAIRLSLCTPRHERSVPTAAGRRRRSSGSC